MKTDRTACKDRPRSPSRTSGFLLVEALATMAISAFILIALASVVSLTLRASHRAAGAGQDIEDQSRVMASLGAEIERVAATRWGGAESGFVFAGNARSLSFATRAIGLQESQVISFRFTPDAAVARLIRSAAILTPGARSLDDLSFGSSQEVYHGRYGFEFAYFGKLDAGRDALVDDWARTDRLPVAIRVSMTDLATGITQTSLRIPLRVDAEPGCAAPGRAACAFVGKDKDGRTVTDSGQTAAEAPIDPDDPRGWLNYGQP